MYQLCTTEETSTVTSNPLQYLSAFGSILERNFRNCMRLKVLEPNVVNQRKHTLVLKLTL